MRHTNRENRVWSGVKAVLTQNTLIEIATIFLSACIEIFRQIFVYIHCHDGAFNVKDTLGTVIVNFDTANAILNIILITLIIWCVTGVASMIKTKDAGRKSLVFTLVVFGLLFITLLWYMASVFFRIDSTFLAISGVLAGLMFILLSIYFSDKPKMSNPDDNDNIIAPKLRNKE